MLKLMLLRNVLSETNHAPFKTDLLFFHSKERPKKKKLKKFGGKLAHGMLVFKKTRVGLMETQASRVLLQSVLCFIDSVLEAWSFVRGLTGWEFVKTGLFA